jgi:hypothetical protein
MNELIRKVIIYFFGFVYMLGAITLIGLLMSGEDINSISLTKIFDIPGFLILFIASLFVLPLSIDREWRNKNKKSQS